MNLTFCPSCGSDHLNLEASTKPVVFKGLELDVAAEQTACGSCGYEFVTSSQHDANLSAVRKVYRAQFAKERATKGLLSGSAIRSIREALGLTQKEAAELFGGGPVAFSKYENDEVLQSASMDALLRLVGHMGQFGVITLRQAKLSKTIANESAERKGVALPVATVHVVVSSNTPAPVEFNGTEIASLSEGALTFRLGDPQRLESTNQVMQVEYSAHPNQLLQ